MSENIEVSKTDSIKEVHYDYIEDQIRVLSGKILTIIDASISDKQQNKCVKDLIKSEVFRRISDIQNFWWDGKRGSVGGFNLELKDSDPLN